MAASSLNRLGVALLLPALLTAADPQPAAKVAQILYFKAKPGKFDDYNKYIREIADPIDEAARKDGAFLALTTFVNPDPAAHWSHMRLFTFESRDQIANFSKKMDAAGIKVFPDAKKRQENTARSASVRDRVGDAVVVDILH